MTANINPDTLIAYGYISANALDPDVVNELMEGTDVYYEEAWKDYIAHERALYDEIHEEGDEFDPEDFRDNFNDSYNPDEPIHEGELEGVKYRTSWLGGALNVWCFFSPHVGRFRPCSPCVPGAADLDSPDPGGIEGYDVPPSWRDNVGR